MVHIRKLLQLKNSQNMEEKDKTKMKPLREKAVDSDPNPQLSCHKAAAGTGEKGSWKVAAGPAQCLHKTLLQNCTQ